MNRNRHILDGDTWQWKTEVLDGRGWKGDVRTMLLDTSRLKALGQKVRYSSKEAIGDCRGNNI